MQSDEASISAELNSQEEPEDPRIGMELQGRYRIVRPLGEGGMGCVYEGEHLGIGKRVAIKCLNPEFAQDTQIVQRFRREARAATAIGNEHIIDVTDIGDLPDGSPYMVMEFLKGHELAGLLDDMGPMPIARAIRIVLQVCDALSAAHEAGIVHRDLKPENIFLIPRGNDSDFVKVLDFGISKMQSAPHLAEASLTQTGIAMGTPHYMSPEQAQALKTLDHRTDLYALGVILYRALAGIPPFDAETYPMLMVQVITQDPKSIRVLRPDVPEGLETAIMRSLEKNPEERFATAKEMAAALRPFLEHHGVPEVSAGAFAPTMRPPENGTLPSGSEGSDVLITGSGTLVQTGERAVSRGEGSTEALGGVGAPDDSASALPRTRLGEASAPLAAQVPPRAGSDGASVVDADDPTRGLTGTQPLPVAAGAHRARIVLALGLLVFVVGGGVLLMSMLSGPAETASGTPESGGAEAQMVSTEQAVEASVEVAETGDSASRTTEGATGEVRIRVVAQPADAKVFIGDQQYPNPVDASRPRELDPVTIRIEREGYETVEELVVLDHDRSFSFRLREQVAETRPTPRQGGRRAGAGMAGSSAMAMASGAGTGRSDIYRGSMMAFRNEW